MKKIQFLRKESTKILFDIDDTVSSIATIAIDKHNNTDLFASTDGAIYLFPSDKQGSRKKGIKIIENTDLVTDVRALYVHQTEHQIQ